MYKLISNGSKYRAVVNCTAKTGTGDSQARKTSVGVGGGGGGGCSSRLVLSHL